MDLKEYILPQNTFIGGWYIPSNLCDELIQIYKNNPKNHSPGVVGPPVRIDPERKESTEIAFSPKYNHPSFIIYKKYLEEAVHRYQAKYPETVEFLKFGLIESPNIQYYKPGQGFKIWHYERSSKEENRCLVFMTYLNDVPDGGTHFKYQDLTTPAEKGLTLIWPTDFTHTHKGQVTKKHEKYILTGWLGYI
jgi:hypothetical protein